MDRNRSTAYHNNPQSPTTPENWRYLVKYGLRARHRKTGKSEEKAKFSAFSGLVVVDSKLEKLAAQALVTLLPRETEEEKIRILQLLGSAGESASVDAMQVELSGGTTRVRRRAAIELGQLRSDRAVGGLIEALSDQDRGVRQFAWRALRVITGERHPKDDQTAWRSWHEGR